MEEEAKMLDVEKVLSLIEKIKKNADELKTVSESYGASDLTGSRSHFGTLYSA